MRSLRSAVLCGVAQAMQVLLGVTAALQLTWTRSGKRRRAWSRAWCRRRRLRTCLRRTRQRNRRRLLRLLLSTCCARIRPAVFRSPRVFLCCPCAQEFWPADPHTDHRWRCCREGLEGRPLACAALPPPTHAHPPPHKLRNAYRRRNRGNNPTNQLMDRWLREAVEDSVAARPVTRQQFMSKLRNTRRRVRAVRQAHTPSFLTPTPCSSGRQPTSSATAGQRSWMCCRTRHRHGRSRTQIS